MPLPLSKEALAEQANPNAPVPLARARVGQATAVEQSRAVAEVRGAIVLAQQRPRDKAAAIAEMEESCRIKELAEGAFFKFSRGGQSVTGASIHLARELARCWGNIDYGIKELSRDDGHGQSEMLAFAWDLETNVRAETVFIVPHIRDTKNGPKAIADVRDIYENNANMGARRLREQIFAVLPRWFTEQAEGICHDTLQNGGGEPLPMRVTKMVKAFEALGVSKARIEKKVGCTIDKIDAVALANLSITYKSIKRSEVQIADEFPEDKAALAEAALKAAEPTPEPAKEAPKSAAPQEPEHVAAARATLAKQAPASGKPSPIDDIATLDRAAERGEG
ncbi:conserved hypothetical protein [uncultured Alphaproteobacteria bacterium]|uniref:Uncharacterized protein n=1 Tax=uncultured Alphaproteobacteria bacterium TaxID=91750 RepID=A0A212KLZ8_9PROT|nr:conserved hypothetical protein [uncultured Alphaproteobacteria bacterium]